MIDDPLIVGTRDGEQRKIFVITERTCVSLQDHLAHWERLGGITLEWGSDSVNTLCTCIAVLYLVTGDAQLAHAAAGDYMIDVFKWFDPLTFEIKASAIEQYVQLWQASPCRAKKVYGTARVFRNN